MHKYYLYTIGVKWLVYLTRVLTYWLKIMNDIKRCLVLGSFLVCPPPPPHLFSHSLFPYIYICICMYRGIIVNVYNVKWQILTDILKNYWQSMGWIYSNYMWSLHFSKFINSMNKTQILDIIFSKLIYNFSLFSIPSVLVRFLVLIPLDFIL